MKGKKKGAFVLDSPICLVNTGDIRMGPAEKKKTQRKTMKHNAEWIKEPLETFFVQTFLIATFVDLFILYGDYPAPFEKVRLYNWLLNLHWLLFVYLPFGLFWVYCQFGKSYVKCGLIRYNFFITSVKLFHLLCSLESGLLKSSLKDHLCDVMKGT